MNFNEPIVLSTGSGLGSSSLGALRPRTAELSSSSSAAAPSSTAPALQLLVGSVSGTGAIDPVEEARLLARKKQMELERMHEQVRRDVVFNPHHLQDGSATCLML